MAVLLVLLGMGLAVIGAPILLFREYRRELYAPRTDRPRLPPTESVLDGLVRSGQVARDHRLALRAGVFRGLMPAWLVALALMLLGVYLA